VSAILLKLSGEQLPPAGGAEGAAGAAAAADGRAAGGGGAAGEGGGGGAAEEAAAPRFALLDCGEGTLGQLRLKLGAAGAQRAVDALGLVWPVEILPKHFFRIERACIAQQLRPGSSCLRSCSALS